MILILQKDLDKMKKEISKLKKRVTGLTRKNKNLERENRTLKAEIRKLLRANFRLRCGIPKRVIRQRDADLSDEENQE